MTKTAVRPPDAKVNLNRALNRARRLHTRALRKPLGSNGRTKDIEQGRALVGYALGLAREQGWEGQMLTDRQFRTLTEDLDVAR